MSELKQRKLVEAQTKWVTEVGYSRAVRAGNHVFVSGTTAVDAHGEVIAPRDAYAQTVAILEKIDAALREADCSLESVVRTRAFLTNIEDWRSVGRAHSEFFASIRPASSMVEVRRLLADDLVVEIEADAVIIDAASATGAESWRA
jgi:enamine deaminase RidA (YjgF/YER057c/UK114 family)